MDDWGVSARVRDVVLLAAGGLDAFGLGNNENPPVAPVDGDAMVSAGYKPLFFFLVRIKQKAPGLVLASLFATLGCRNCITQVSNGR